ncbi:MAG: DUF378 domain-containing protein [Chlamydiia bacterium]|nr:DUF378 domain-containing protein [Chlamydiia bacterium]
MKKVDTIAIILILISAFNAGLVGFVEFDLLDFLICPGWLLRFFDALVGISAIYTVVNWHTIRHRWKN